MSIPPKIPIPWILSKIDRWVEIAQHLQSGPMADSAALRAEHYMELIEAWKVEHAEGEGSNDVKR